MATDKEYSTNDEVNRSEEFQKKVNLKESIIDFLKETLVSVTDSVFKKAGYTKNEKNAGEYGDGSKYGAGAVENQYIVTIAGKTKSVLTKKIIMDGKSISSDIEIVYKDNIVEFNYLTTEQGFFRGVDKDGNTYTINQRFALDSKDMTKLKSELKSKLEAFAEKELGYLTSTKIGVADKSNKSTSSVVEHKNLNMKKLTIKELFEMDDENGNEIKTSINERISPELFKSAINVSKERGTDNRTRKLGELYFDRFIGKPLMGGIISNIHVTAPQQGNYRNVRIEITYEYKNAPVVPDSLKNSYITYDIDKDLYDVDTINHAIDRKDARILSLIALQINPNSQYKESGRYFNIKGLNENFERNSEKIKDLNTLDLRDTNPPIDSDKQLFFDDKEVEEGMGHADTDSNGGLDFVKSQFKNSLSKIKSALGDSFKVINLNDNQATVFINGIPYDLVGEDDGYDESFLVLRDFPETGESVEGGINDIITAVRNDIAGLKTMAGTDMSMNEVTTAGPTITGSEGGYKDGAQSGSGGYKTPNAWKKTAYAKGQQKRPKVTHDYKVVAEESEEDQTKDKKSPVEKKGTSTPDKKTSSKLQDVTPKSTGKDIKSEQPSNKNNGVVEPESTNNSNPKTGNETWKNTNQTKAPKSSSDDFWTEVDLIPGTGYVPKGMDQNYVAGMHDRPGDLKKLGLAENKQPDLTKKKFFSLDENKKLGINKRYLVTEKTTEEYEKERFRKLANFKTRETIKEAEEMNNFFDSLQESKDPKKVFTFKRTLNENTEDIFEEKPVNQNPNQVEGVETVDVEKPGSKFKMTYKFFKPDFLNEQKMFILDLNSKTYVKNPNFIQK